MSEPRSKLTIPRLEWKTATCKVCGAAFDYHGRRRPATCRSLDCRYKFEHGIDRNKWAGSQISLFDSADSSR